MIRAKNYILAQGGLEKAQTITKFKLALFGKMPWSEVYHIPLRLFDPNSYFYIKDITAQWVYPHMLPLAYLRD
jgi:squalene-hopene/tetraprenyl-beta-curcumene cyclase